VKYLVFDEADRMFEDCFHKDLMTIMKSLTNEERRTYFFSATEIDVDIFNKLSIDIGQESEKEFKVHNVNLEFNTTVKDLD
jgi:superfamily II DNA/RNA helicase